MIFRCVSIMRVCIVVCSIFWMVSTLAAQVPELKNPGHNLDVNAINKAHHYFPWLRGAGRVCSIKEYPFDTADVDLLGRALPPIGGSLFETDEHATVMATQIGGNGVSEKAAEGVAPACVLSSSGYNDLMPDAPADYLLRGVHVQNHSYGNDPGNWYSANARAYDVSTEQNPNLLHVFSAGNAGVSAGTSGQYQGLQGWANLTGHYKTGKNVLLVGATDSSGQVWAYSSRGPASDGRIKPDLAAFSQNGTSGAAALVSGTALLVQEALGGNPPSELQRAILLNSATDTGEPGPDYAGGFGNLNAFNAIATALNGRHLGGELQNGEVYSMQLEIPPKTARFKLTLCWNDPPAAENASKTLLHDLDLTAIDPAGASWQPWVLRTHPDSLAWPAYRGRDQVNNTEQISVELPAPGTWTIHVRWNNGGSGAQTFALAWSTDSIGHFAWNYPTAADGIIGGNNSLLRWETTLPAQAGLIEYNFTHTGIWHRIDSVSDIRDALVRWLPPPTFGAVRLRMSCADGIFLSDTFLLGPEIRVNVGLNCPDSLLLFWNAAGPGASYLLSVLGDRYMEPQLVLSDTAIVLLKQDYPQQRFAITPLGPGGLKGWQSPAPDIYRQGAGCYIDNFLAEALQGNTALRLRLGTLYNVEQVAIERLNGIQFEPLGTWNAPFSVPEFSTVDPAPAQGINFYRARIELAQNRELYSDTLQVVFARENGYLVFPNPARPGARIQVLADGSSEDARFMLTDRAGRIILEKALTDYPFPVELPPMPAGIYTAWVQENGRVIGCEKLVVY